MKMWMWAESGVEWGGVQEVFAEWVGVEHTVARRKRTRTIFADHT